MFPSPCKVLSTRGRDKITSERDLSEEDKQGWIVNCQNSEDLKKQDTWLEMQIIKDHTCNGDLIASCIDTDTSDKDEVESNNSTSAAIPVPSGKSPRTTPNIKSTFTETSNNSKNENIVDGPIQQNEEELFNEEPVFSPISMARNQSVDIKDSGRVISQCQTNSNMNHSDQSSASKIGLHSINHSYLRAPKKSCASKASSGYASFFGGTSSRSCPSLSSLPANASEGKQQSLSKIPGFRSQDPSGSHSYSNFEELRESYEPMYVSDDPLKLQQNSRVEENDNNRPMCRRNCEACCKDFDDIQGARFDGSSVETNDASTSPHMSIGQIWRNVVKQCQCGQAVINPVTVQKQDGLQMKKVSHSYEYDAYLDYNIQDRTWAFNLQEILEGPPYKFRIYLHERDGILGRHTIPDIADQLQNSFKYICVLSPHFLNSSKAMGNLYMAQHEQNSYRQFISYVILLKIAPCEIPLSLKSLHWEDCTRKTCKYGPDRYVVNKVVKAIRDVT